MATAMAMTMAMASADDVHLLVFLSLIGEKAENSCDRK